ncbi:MAG: beta-N-acetylhexosaminidase [Gammaproteobacteria bacterium]
MSLGPLMIDLRGTSIDDEELHWLASPAVCGVILFSRNYESGEQLERLVTSIHDVRDPPLLVAVDQEGGRVQRFVEPFTRLPPLRTLGHLYDVDVGRALTSARAFGWLMAAELLAFGVDLSFAPVVDLDRGLAEVIGDRAFHSSATAVCQLASAFAAGAHEAGMAIAAKHFPTHAGVISDSHTESAVDTRNFNDLWDDLQPYRHLINGRLDAIMVAHVSFPDVDPIPASFSPWWLTEQLRGQLDFGGAIISDDISMIAAETVGSYAERAQAALSAGCDLVLLCNAPDEIPAVLDALDGYSSPVSQLHLMRLHGRGMQGWETLRASSEWAEAQKLVQSLSARPEIKLEG